MIGAAVVVASLFAISAVVWTSPALSPVHEVSDVVRALDDNAKLTAERDRLASQVASLQMQVDAKNQQIDSFEAKLRISTNTAADTQSNLTVANQSVASLQAQLSQLQGKMKALTTKKTSTVSSAAAITAPTKAQLLAPASPYFGLYTEQSPFNWSGYDSIAAKIGAEPSVAGYFQGWDQDFRADAVTRSWQKGALPIMTWESRPIASTNNVTSAPAYSLPNIVRGDFDSYLHQYAKAIVATGLPLGIRLDHEMNATWYPWAEDDGHGAAINGNTAGSYIAMWRHVHDIFQAEGANSLVIWIWAPNRVDNLTTAHQSLAYTRSLYPGDDVVDWVGMSGYLRPPYLTNQTYSFAETFGKTLTQLRAISSKPIFLAEVGASETGGHKPTWVNNFFAGLEDPSNSDIVGFAWFDLAISTYVQGQLATNDWRIDSRPESLAAFKAGLLGPGTRFVLTVPPQ